MDVERVKELIKECEEDIELFDRPSRKNSMKLIELAREYIGLNNGVSIYPLRKHPTSNPHEDKYVELEMREDI